MEFHIPHVQILGTNHCGYSHQNVFKGRESFQDVLCRRDYDDRVVASFAHQIKSEYYDVNRSVYIKGIPLEHFIALPQTEINSSKKSYPCHAVLHFSLSDDSKQDAATNTAHIERLIELLKEQKVLTSTLSTLWENTDGCAEQYRCASALYIMSVLSQCFSIIFDQGISVSVHGK